MSAFAIDDFEPVSQEEVKFEQKTKPVEAIGHEKKKEELPMQVERHEEKKEETMQVERHEDGKEEKALQEEAKDESKE